MLKNKQVIEQITLELEKLLITTCNCNSLIQINSLHPFHDLHQVLNLKTIALLSMYHT